MACLLEKELASLLVYLWVGELDTLMACLLEKEWDILLVFLRA